MRQRVISIGHLPIPKRSRYITRSYYILEAYEKFSNFEIPITALTITKGIVLYKTSNTQDSKID